MFAPRRAVTRLLRTPKRALRRLNSTYQPPEPAKGTGNPHRAFYKTFGRPIAKVFLGALFTYQVIYWSWVKLEAIEEKHDKDGKR